MEENKMTEIIVRRLDNVVFNLSNYKLFPKSFDLSKFNLDENIIEKLKNIDEELYEISFKAPIFEEKVNFENVIFLYKYVYEKYPQVFLFLKKKDNPLLKSLISTLQFKKRRTKSIKKIKLYYYFLKDTFIDFVKDRNYITNAEIELLKYRFFNENRTKYGIILMLLEFITSDKKERSKNILTKKQKPLALFAQRNLLNVFLSYSILEKVTTIKNTKRRNNTISPRTLSEIKQDLEKFGIKFDESQIEFLLKFKKGTKKNKVPIVVYKVNHSKLMILLKTLEMIYDYIEGTLEQKNNRLLSFKILKRNLFLFFYLAKYGILEYKNDNLFLRIPKIKRGFYISLALNLIRQRESNKPIIIFFENNNNILESMKNAFRTKYRIIEVKNFKKFISKFDSPDEYKRKIKLNLDNLFKKITRIMDIYNMLIILAS
jgi:hypothetical protein